MVLDRWWWWRWITYQPPGIGGAWNGSGSESGGPFAGGGNGGGSFGAYGSANGASRGTQNTGGLVPRCCNNNPITLW